MSDQIRLLMFWCVNNHFPTPEKRRKKDGWNIILS